MVNLVLSKDEEKEQTLRLELNKVEGGCVDVIGIDKLGKCHKIVRITKEGKLYRHRDVSGCIGIALDDDRRIREYFD